MRFIIFSKIKKNKNKMDINLTDKNFEAEIKKQADYFEKADENISNLEKNVKSAEMKLKKLSDNTAAGI